MFFMSIKSIFGRHYYWHFWITLIHLLVHFDENLKHSETRENLLNVLYI